MALYLACDLADYNSATGECSAPYFTEMAPPSPSVLPPLTVAEGSLVAGAILLVLGIAFTFKAARKALD